MAPVGLRPFFRAYNDMQGLFKDFACTLAKSKIRQRMFVI